MQNIQEHIEFINLEIAYPPSVAQNLHYFPTMTKPVPTPQSHSANKPSTVQLLSLIEATLDLIDTDDFLIEDPPLPVKCNPAA